MALYVIVDTADNTIAHETAILKSHRAEYKKLQEQDVRAFFRYVPMSADKYGNIWQSTSTRGIPEGARRRFVRELDAIGDFERVLIFG